MPTPSGRHSAAPLRISRNRASRAARAMNSEYGLTTYPLGPSTASSAIRSAASARVTLSKPTPRISTVAGPSDSPTRITNLKHLIQHGKRLRCNVLAAHQLPAVLAEPSPQRAVREQPHNTFRYRVVIFRN